MLVEVSQRKPSKPSETLFEREKDRVGLEIELVNQMTRYKFKDHCQNISRSLDREFILVHEDWIKSHTQEPSSDTMLMPSLPRGSSSKSKPELSDDAKTCIQILESAMGRPTNPNITAKDLDSMLADYVDEKEDSAELVRSVRDGTE